jgi:GxxExxY protein
MPLIRNPVVERVIGCAIEVHKQIGPGLLESAYDACLTREFALTGLRFNSGVVIPILYKGATVGCAYRADGLLINFNVPRLVEGLRSLRR